MVSVDISDWHSAPFAVHGESVFAIGDIHGCAEHLAALLETVRDLAREAPGPRRLVYLGDLIDRGPDSLGVLRLWAEEAQTRGLDRVDRLIGNHEILMLLAVRGGQGADKAAATWLTARMGGGKMLAEMRATVGNPNAPLGQDLAIAAIGRRTLDLLLSQRGHLRLGNTLFVHAGLDGRADAAAFLAPPWTAGTDARWAWITHGFLDWQGGFGGTLVVHGHTPPEKHRAISDMAGTNVFLHDRLCLDGGSALTGLVVGAEIRDGRYRLLKAR